MHGYTGARVVRGVRLVCVPMPVSVLVGRELKI